MIKNKRLKTITKDIYRYPSFYGMEHLSDGVPVIRGEHIDEIGSLSTDWSDYWFVSEDVSEQFPRTILSIGDLVFTVRGTIGKVALVGAKHNGAQLSPNLIRISPDHSKVDPQYLWYFFIWVRNTNEAVIQNAATVATVKASDLANLPIPLPPLDEQKRIAAILEEADHARRTRRFTQGVSDGFLQEVFVEIFGDPVTNPMRWEVVHLNKHVRKIDSGWSPVCEGQRSNSDEWAVLGLGSVTWSVFDPTENKKLPDDIEPRPEVEVKSGDVLFVRKNTHDLVGNSVFVHRTPQRLLLPDTIFRFVFSDSGCLCPEYLWGLISNPQFKKYKIQILASGTAGSMPNISKTKLMDVDIPLPSVELQRRFANIVHEKEITHIQQQESARQAEHLFQTLLHRAFRGEL